MWMRITVKSNDSPDMSYDCIDEQDLLDDVDEDYCEIE
jgi:hypothetical protein